jgi:hypothetical protein
MISKATIKTVRHDAGTLSDENARALRNISEGRQ